MNDFLSSDQVKGLLNVGAWDLSVKIGATLAVGAAGASAIAVPNRRQKEEAAVNLFDKPWALLTPQEQRVAEFSAGHKRWNDFFQTKVFPLTRKLPGAKTPILNPYRDAAEPFKAADDDE